MQLPFFSLGMQHAHDQTSKQQVLSLEQCWPVIEFDLVIKPVINNLPVNY
jgi:hypothetical protein